MTKGFHQPKYHLCFYNKIPVILATMVVVSVKDIKTMFFFIFNKQIHIIGLLIFTRKLLIFTEFKINI